MEVPAKPKAVIMARVFRAKQIKPRYMPGFLWAIALRKKWRIAGRWENHGTIASTDMGNAQVVTK